MVYVIDFKLILRFLMILAFPHDQGILLIYKDFFKIEVNLKKCYDFFLKPKRLIAMLNTHEKKFSTPIQVGAVGLNTEIDPKSLSSVTLARLAEEVKNHGPMVYGSFDRVFNRHNR